MVYEKHLDIMLTKTISDVFEHDGLTTAVVLSKVGVVLKSKENRVFSSYSSAVLPLKFSSNRVWGEIRKQCSSKGDLDGKL